MRKTRTKTKHTKILKVHIYVVYFDEYSEKSLFSVLFILYIEVPLFTTRRINVMDGKAGQFKNSSDLLHIVLRKLFKN